MIRRFFYTENDFATFWLRLTLGLVMLPHGLQKVFGWFGGYGFEGTMTFFTQSLHVPYFLALLAILAESLGSVLLLIGFLTRLSALGIACNMVVAIFMVHLKNGFFMNWGNNLAGEGFEYHLLAIGIAVALMLRGGGRWSVDRKLTEM